MARYLKVFDDWRSYIHMLLGFITGLLPIWIQAPILLIFFIYQGIESRSWREVFADLLELYIGYSIAKIAVPT